DCQGRLPATNPSIIPLASHSLTPYHSSGSAIRDSSPLLFFCFSCLECGDLSPLLFCLLRCERPQAKQDESAAEVDALQTTNRKNKGGDKSPHSKRKTPPRTLLVADYFSACSPACSPANSARSAVRARIWSMRTAPAVRFIRCAT